MHHTNEGYSVVQAATLAGLSKTMLEYLCRARLVMPTASPCRGRGHQRLYSFGDVVILRVVSRLLHNGISVSRMRAALDGLRKHHVWVTRGSLPSALLVTDGRTVYLRRGHETLEDLIGGQMAFAFVVELAGIEREIAAKAAKRRVVMKRMVGNLA